MENKRISDCCSRFLSIILALTLSISPITVFGAGEDVANHWAKDTITTWQSKGLIKGYEDGSFKPDNAVTRGEFIRLMNQALELSNKGAVNFSDVAQTDWFYNDVAIAMGEGYTAGFPDGTFQPNQNVTRAQAAVFVSKAVKLSGGTTDSFTDAASIPAWANDAIGAMVKEGYFSGYPDGSFRANAVLTRAEAVSMLNRAMGGSAEPTATAAKDVVIDKAGAKLENQTIDGNVLVSEAVGDGEVYLNNLTIQGDLIIQGGGSNSVYIENTIIKGKVVAEKKGVHIQIAGKTEISEMEVLQGCNFQSASFNSTIGTITIMDAITDKTTIAVPAKKLIVDKKANLFVTKDIEEIIIAEDAKDTKLEIATGATMDTIEANARLALSGAGKIELLEANANGITVVKTLKITKTVTATGVSSPTQSTSSGGSGGSGGGSSSGSDDKDKVQVTGISINQTTASVAVGSSVSLTATIEPANASNKTVTWTSDKPATATVSDGVVKGIAKGTAIITATSNNGKTATCTVTVTDTNKPTNPEEPENPDKPGEPEEPDEVDAALLDTAEELVAAIEENYGEPIILQGDILGNVVATYAGNDDIIICLNGHSLGDVNITAPGAEKIEFLETPPTKMVTLAVAPYFASQRKAFNIGKLKLDAPIAKIDLSVAIADVIAAVKEVAVNKSVQKLTATNETGTTKVSGTGSVDTVVAETPIDISTETVSEVVAKAPVDINTNVGTVSVPEDESEDAATDVRVTVGEGKTIDSLQTGKSVVLEGSGTVKTVNVTTTTTTTVTVNGTTTVTTVVKSETTTVTIEGSSENKPTEPVTISEITLNGEPKASYFVGEVLDVSGLTLTVTYSDNTSHDVTVTPSMVKGFDSSTATETPQTLTVGLAGKTATFDIAIVEPKVTSITIKAGQYKKLYSVGDALDVSKLTIIATYETEVKKEISGQNTNVAVTGFDNNKIGAQKLTITFGEQTASYTVIVSQITPVINGAIAATDITTGQALSESTLSGTFKVSEASTDSVAGELAWDDDTTIVNETGNYPWTFVPENATKYAVVRGTVSVKATDPAKKDPVADEAVTATALTKGEALSVSKLKGTFKAEGAALEGTLAWADGTVIVKETGKHAWIFTPTDTTTYNVATGKIEVTANDMVINPTAEQKIDITARIKVANKMASSNVVAGAIDGVTPGVAVSGATGGTESSVWAVDDQPVATITYTPAKDKTFAGSSWANENFSIPKGATIEVKPQGDLLQVVVTCPTLSLSPAEELIMARRAIEAGVYEIPNESQGSEGERIAWLQEEVDKKIPQGNQTTAVVTFKDGKYIVELSIEGATLSGDTATITVTEATSAQKELDKIIKNLTSITVPLPDESTVYNTIAATAQKMISKDYIVRIENYTYNQEESKWVCGFVVSPKDSQDSSNDARTEQDVTIKIINKGAKPSISALEGVPLKYDRLNPSDIRFKYTLGEGGYALCQPTEIYIAGYGFSSASFVAENGEIRIPKAILENTRLPLGLPRIKVSFQYLPEEMNQSPIIVESNELSLEVIHENASTSTEILSDVYDIDLALKTIKSKEGAAKEAQITIDVTVEEFMQRITAKDKWQGISMMHQNASGNWEYKSKEKFLAEGDAVQVTSETGTATVRYKLIMTPYVSTAADELAKIKIQEDPYYYFSVPTDADLNEITHLILEKAKTMIKGDYEVTTQDVTITEGNNPLKTWHGKFVVTNTKNAEDTATGETTDVGLALSTGSKQESIIFSIPGDERADHNTLVIKLARGKFVEDIEEKENFEYFSLKIGGMDSQGRIRARRIDLSADRTEATVKINKEDSPNQAITLYMGESVFDANAEAIIRPYHVEYAFSTEAYSSSTLPKVKDDEASKKIIKEIVTADVNSTIKIAPNSDAADVLNALTSDDDSAQRYKIYHYNTYQPITSGIITGKTEELKVISEDGLNEKKYSFAIVELTAGELLEQLDLTSVYLTSEDEAQEVLPVESRIVAVLSEQIANTYKLELLEGTFDDSTADETVAGKWTGKIKITNKTDSSNTATSESAVDITIYKSLKTPTLTGASLADDPDSEDSTKVTLPAPTDVNNTFVYMISTDENVVATPTVGDVLGNDWTAIADGGVIQVEHDKNIGFAEIDADRQVLKFINLTAVVGTASEETAAPELTGVSLADDPDTSDSTKVTLPTPESGNSFVYLISTDTEAVPTPIAGAKLTNEWTAIEDGGIIQAEHGKNIGFAEVDASNTVVKFINLTAVVEG